MIWMLVFISVNETCAYIWDLRNQFFVIPIIRKQLKNIINFSKNTCQINSLLLSRSSYIQPSGNSTAKFPGREKNE